MRSAVGGRVRHDLLDFEARFVLEQAIENVERVADRPGADDGVKPGELVGGRGTMERKRTLSRSESFARRGRPWECPTVPRPPDFPLLER